MSKLKCFNCGTNGHGVRECPDISCHYCHDRGHIVDNCPKKRHRSPVASDAGSDHGQRTTTTTNNSNNNNMYTNNTNGNSGHHTMLPANQSSSNSILPPLQHHPMNSGGPSGSFHVGSSAGIGHANNNAVPRFVAPYHNNNAGYGNGGGYSGPDGTGSDKCYTCKEYGHRSEACAQTVCHECGRRGHIAKMCPNRHANMNNNHNNREEKKCYFCKRKGHQIADCDLKRQYPSEDKLCYMCLKPGHHANECSNDAVCHMCSNSGHISSECPIRECTHCHGHGHSMGKCPTVRCFRCNENGHMANECEDEAIGIVLGTNTNATATTAAAGQHSTGGPMFAAPSAASAARPSAAASSSSNASPLPLHAPAAAIPLTNQALQLHNTLRMSPTTAHPPSQQSAAAPQQQQPQQQQAAPQFPAIAPIPPLEDASSAAAGATGRVCVLIDGAYFEACVRQQQYPASADTNAIVPDYGRVRVALQHALHHIGTIFNKTPYGFWFDMDPSSLSEFIEQEFHQPQRDATMRRLHAKHSELITHMCSGRALSNVVTRLVGKIRHRPIVSSMGYGSSWMPAGVDVALGTSIIECFESKQFAQVVVLSGDGALCPAVDYCNTKRQGMGMESTKPPVRVCGGMHTMDALFGSRQELVDFLPRIFLDAAEHVEEGRKVPFAVHGAFQ